jgi:hypothetical protein
MAPIVDEQGDALYLKFKAEMDKKEKVRKAVQVISS